MKRKIYILLFALCATWGLQSCDDNDSIAVSKDIQEAFRAKFPNAKNVEWENKAGYYVADFKYSKYGTSAWFDAQGEWMMTETNIPYGVLPEKVRSTFEQSEYASWRKDDIDKLERREMEAIYIIEVEKGEQEADLYYSEDGILIRSLTDGEGNGEHQPSKQLPDAITRIIQEKYPNARLIDAEFEKTMWEVEIRHDGRSKEVLFDSLNKWVLTSWDIAHSQLPSLAAVEAIYPSYRVDDAEYFETPDNEYILLELEKSGAKDVLVRIDTDGNILN